MGRAVWGPRPAEGPGSGAEGGGTTCLQFSRVGGREEGGFRKEAPPHAFCAGLRARGGLRLIPRGPSRAERGGVGNLGKEVLIEDYGLRRVFFFFLSCL